MSRLKNTIQNAKVSVFFHVIFIFTQFFARKIFLDNLGDDFIGLTSTLQSFLSFLNLAELGIGTAIGFTLYKPIFDKNYVEINHIIRFFGNVYKKIGLAIIGLSLILSGFFPLIFENTNISLPLIYYAFFTFLTSSLLGYFFNYHMLLFQADQKEYMVAKYLQTYNILKIVLQIIFVFYFQSFIAWITLELISSVLFTISLRKKTNSQYPWLKLSFSKEETKNEFKSYPQLIKKIKQISLHKIGTFVSNGTDNILIFSFINVETVAFFGNYQLIILNFATLLNKMFSGTNASVGNLVAEHNQASIKQVFWELMSFRFFIAGIVGIGIITLVDPFIVLWLGEKYILSDSTVALFAINFFMLQIRQPVDVFKQAYGLYSDTWAPIAQSVINLSVSVLLVTKFGLTGILLGTTCSLVLIIMLWRPFFLFTKAFHLPFYHYIIGFLKLSLTFIPVYIGTSFIINNFLKSDINNYYDFITFAIFVSIITIGFYGGLLYLTDRYFRDLIKRLINGVKKR
ncbi:lipopolysaccharide biosynthesis protein [Zobellia roscoffensis]|uniref:lipopolysaccharide biosynthesis protein n=1 Tax=Zobellia roscoffensis TaxID=2779508 RepID=UPI00188A1FE7|nr:sugar transporter [Zobellia roscoffensis]